MRTVSSSPIDPDRDREPSQEDETVTALLAAFGAPLAGEAAPDWEAQRTQIVLRGLPDTLGGRATEHALELADRGRLDDAIDVLRRAALAEEKALGGDDLHLAGTLRALGALLLRKAEYRESEATYERARQIAMDAYGQAHADAMDALAGRSRAQMRGGRVRDAQRFLRFLVDGCRDRPAERAQALHDMAEATRYLGNPEDAEPLFRQAIEGIEQTRGETCPLLVAPLVGRARALQELKRTDESVPLLRRAVALLEIGDDGPTRSPEPLAASVDMLAHAAVLLARASAPGASDVARQALHALQTAPEDSEAQTWRRWLERIAAAGDVPLVKAPER